MGDLKKQHNPLDCQLTFPLRIPDGEEIAGDLDVVETPRQPAMPTPSPSVSGESATILYSRTTKTVAATSMTSASVAHPPRSVPLVSATSTKPTSIASTRKSTSSVPVVSSRSTLETSAKRSTASLEKAIPIVNLVSDNEEDEDVDAPAYEFYSDDSDEDSEEDDGDIEEIEAEESLRH